MKCDNYFNTGHDIEINNPGISYVWNAEALGIICVYSVIISHILFSTVLCVQIAGDAERLDPTVPWLQTAFLPSPLLKTSRILAAPLLAGWLAVSRYRTTKSESERIAPILSFHFGGKLSRNVICKWYC